MDKYCDECPALKRNFSGDIGCGHTNNHQALIRHFDDFADRFYFERSPICVQGRWKESYATKASPEGSSSAGNNPPEESRLDKMNRRIEALEYELYGETRG